jgi:hypothetical protein
MLNKKIVFSMLTIPAAIFCQDSGEWQKRRATEKNHEIKRRTERLNSEPIDITPENGKFVFSGKSPEQIEDEFGFRRVKVKGILDLENNTYVETTNRGEKGYNVITPLYTHVNEKKEPCGLLVNRGFLPKDFLETREHFLVESQGYFEGIIYTGDHVTKYDDTLNVPYQSIWTKVIPNQLSLKHNLKNREDSGVAMLMLVEFDEEHQNVFPSAPTIGELNRWKNTPERHTAYQSFWKYTTYFSLFSNTMFWLYF